MFDAQRMWDLVRDLKSPDPEVRARSAEQLGAGVREIRQCFAESAPLLIQGLKDKDARVAHGCTSVLLSIAPWATHYVSDIIVLLDQGDDASARKLHKWCALVLSRMGHFADAALPILRKRLSEAMSAGRIDDADTFRRAIQHIE